MAKNWVLVVPLTTPNQFSETRKMFMSVGLEGALIVMFSYGLDENCFVNSMIGSSGFSGAKVC